MEFSSSSPHTFTCWGSANRRGGGASRGYARLRGGADARRVRALRWLLGPRSDRLGASFPLGSCFSRNLAPVTCSIGQDWRGQAFFAYDCAARCARRIRLVAYGARLESVLGASPRGFESPILRHRTPGPLQVPGFLLCLQGKVSSWGRGVPSTNPVCCPGEGTKCEIRATVKPRASRLSALLVGSLGSCVGCFVGAG